MVEEPKKEVPNGTERIPTMDCKVFEETDLKKTMLRIALLILSATAMR